ncbi:MAG: YfcE family phosphodiesterase [Patescibacteria group bacterium]
MKIGVIADTHDHVDIFGKVGTVLKDRGVEMIVHCGDWCAPYSVALFAKVMNKMCPNVPINGVFGNNDGDIYRIIQTVESEELAVFIQRDIMELEEDGKKIAIYHGTEEAIVNALLNSGNYQVVMRGHTHVGSIDSVNNTLHINPGTVSSYSNGTILDKVSIAVYDTVAHQAELIFFPR